MAPTARSHRWRRTDVVPWSVLTAVKTKSEKNRILPVFHLDQMALNQKTQRIRVS